MIDALSIAQMIGTALGAAGASWWANRRQRRTTREVAKELVSHTDGNGAGTLRATVERIAGTCDRIDERLTRVEGRVDGVELQQARFTAKVMAGQNELTRQVVAAVEATTSATTPSEDGKGGKV